MFEGYRDYKTAGAGRHPQQGQKIDVDGGQGQQAVTGKRQADDRQQNLFGTPAGVRPSPATETPKRPPEPKARRGRAPPAAPPVDDSKPENVQPEDVQHGHDRLPDRLAQMSAPELRALAESLPDEALAGLLIATIRQLKRRLTKSSRNGQQGRVRALDRAVQQLMAELGDQGYEDDF